MIFPQNGLDYDDEKLKGMAERAQERMTQNAQELELPPEQRRKVSLKKLGTSAAAVVLAVLLIAALVYLCLPRG